MLGLMEKASNDMYGTIARMRIKPGMESRFQEIYKDVQIPGQVNTLVYRMDSDPNELYVAVVFDSKES